MKLVINTPGIYLCKRGNCFQIQKDDVKKEYSAKKVEQILITTRAALSTDAIELAVENNIDIIFLKNTGQPLGRVWHSRLGSISTIRRKQLFLQDHPLGMELVKDWIIQKLENQCNHLNKLAMNRRDDRKEIIKEGIEKIKVQIENISAIPKNKTIDEIRDSMQGYEGSSLKKFQSLFWWILYCDQLQAINSNTKRHTMCFNPCFGGSYIVTALIGLCIAISQF
jgi:CRISPR-associated protein Cas1